MRRFTGWDTSTGRSDRPRRLGSRLTLQILSVNVIAPLVLVLGLLYIGQYRDSLIRAELEVLKIQSELFAGAIAEGAIRIVERGKPFLFARPEEIEVLVPELSRRMVRRLGETSDSRTRLFDRDGDMIGDSQQLVGPGGAVQIVPLEPPADDYSFSAAVAYMGTKILELMPAKSPLPLYQQTASENVSHYPDAARALRGKISATAWRTTDGKVMMTAAAPVQKSTQVMGVVLLTRDGREIDRAMVQVRFDVLTVFLGALSVTIFLSLYLAGIIGRPLKKLAKAAEAIRLGRSREIDIPDLSHRNDEIGELSIALQDMTQALRDRMDTIEHFAADVAHEIKNPLTSLRSAVETAARVKKPEDRDKLMEIIQHDVQRMDRLISDISNASRLDAELSRDEMGTVDLRRLLEQLADLHRAPLERGGKGGEEMPHIILDLPPDGPLAVRGNETRLAQVFENLITNALSFSPDGRPVIVRAQADEDVVRVAVEDEGPGIPDNKLETVFERFYSERPKHEAYGTHSGLGLSIAKQIVEAHGGRIYAENKKGPDGRSGGARFMVLLPSAL